MRSFSYHPYKRHLSLVLANSKDHSLPFGMEYVFIRVFLFHSEDDVKPSGEDDDIIFEDFARLRLKGTEGDA